MPYHTLSKIDVKLKIPRSKLRGMRSLLQFNFFCDTLESTYGYKKEPVYYKS